MIDSQVTLLDEIVLRKTSAPTEKEKQVYFTRQAMEFDADSCAFSMIINMLMMDARARLCKAAGLSLGAQQEGRCRKQQYADRTDFQQH